MVKGGMCGKRGACVAKGGMHGERGGMCGMHTPPTRYGRSLRGRYASYWNAFLFRVIAGSYRPQGRVMFSEASVSHSVYGGSLHPGECLLTGGSASGRSASTGVWLQGLSAYKWVCLQGVSASGGSAYRGVCLQGVSASGGGSAYRGVCLQGGWVCIHQ